MAAQPQAGKQTGKAAGGTTMIVATIKVTVPPEKWKELLQTLKAILEPIRREEGCLCCNCYVDIETENRFLFKEEWQTRDALDNHLRSVQFGVLIGAMSLLDQQPEISFITIASRAGMETVTAARRPSELENRGRSRERFPGTG